jgi:cell division protein ZapE
MSNPVSAALADHIARGRLEADSAQGRLAARLDGLLSDLARNGPVRGVYIWGAAGRGKTLLMDMFFRAAGPKKRRVHFHTFMSEMHERLRAHRNAREQPVVALARTLARETRLLCLDELQVKDIADATILGRLFTILLDEGTAIVATSNAPPDRLYYKGLNRDLFLPFIRLVEARMDIVEIASPNDFRLGKLMAAPVWHVPPDAGAMDAAFARLAGAAEGAPETLRVNGRDLVVRKALGGVARFGFAELCEEPLGAADFRAIAQNFHTVLIDGIPRLDVSGNDAVRRFVLLIDEFYEHRVKLVASADAAPDALLTQGPLAWEFRRTASRLAEMGSHEWLALPHGRPT